MILQMKCFARNNDEIVICDIEIEGNRVSSCYGMADGINGRIYQCTDYARTIAKVHHFRFQPCEFCTLRII